MPSGPVSLVTEKSAPEGYVAQTASQTVTVMPNNSISNTFTFYNKPAWYMALITVGLV